MSARTKHIDALDGLRALAIFLVLSFHYWQQSWVNPVIPFGAFDIDLSIPVVEGSFGVTMLFVISGFGLYYSSRPDRPFSVRTYALKRAARILPTYLICVAVCGAFLVRQLDPYTFRRQFFANLTLTQMTTPEVGYNMINGALWSIAIEAQFYIVFPLLRKIFSKHPYVVTLALYLIAQLWRTWRGCYLYTDDLWFNTNQLIAWIDVFAAGMLAAHVVLELERVLTDEQRASLAPIGALLTVAGLAMIYLAMRYRFVNRYDDVVEGNTRLELTVRPFTALGMVIAVIGCSFPSRVTHACLGNRVAKFFGGISYQVYMWHMFVALRLKDFRIPSYTTERPMDDLVWRPRYLILCIALTMLISVFMTYAAEKPAAKALLRLGRTKKHDSRKTKAL